MDRLKYIALPFSATPAKAETLLNAMIRTENLFNDYMPACKDVCGYCNLCLGRKRMIASKLSSQSSLVYEVWSPTELVGLLYLWEIEPLTDAKAEFYFLDGKLRDKDEIIAAVIENTFETLKLHRLTVTIPEHAQALGKFLVRKLGFQHEGTKREACLWKGRWEDVMLYGLVSPNGSN